jgi:hypothetical protein
MEKKLCSRIHSNYIGLRLSTVTPSDSQTDLTKIIILTNIHWGLQELRY